MNSLAKKSLIPWLDPLLFDMKTAFIEHSSKCGIEKRDTAPTLS